MTSSREEELLDIAVEEVLEALEEQGRRGTGVCKAEVWGRLSYSWQT